MNRYLRPLLAALVALCLALAASACGDDDDDDGGGDGGGAPASEAIQSDPANANTRITVGSKNFPEQFVLGEIYAQALEAAGFDVRKQLNIGSEVVAFKALRQGEIDAYPEYTGTVLTALLNRKTEDLPKDPDVAYEQVVEGVADDNLTAFPRTPFENTYRLGLLKERAEELGVTTTSDLAGEAADLTITGYPECRQRLDCLLGVERVYNLEFGDFVASESTYEVLDQGEADVGFLFTTDAQLSTGDYTALEDDERFFPPYNITLLMRNAKAEALGDAGREMLERIQEPLTEEIMIELNSRVVIDKEKPEDVAAEYLRAEGFIE